MGSARIGLLRQPFLPAMRQRRGSSTTFAQPLMPPPGISPASGCPRRGYSKSNPRQIFVAIDGDQNAAMNEMDKVLASDYPENLHWFILNNGTGESVGPSLSLPLCPWHYDPARVINTRNIPPGSFKHSPINSSGLKFESEEARALAKEIGSLPAQAHLARRILAARM